MKLQTVMLHKQIVWAPCGLTGGWLPRLHSDRFVSSMFLSTVKAKIMKSKLVIVFIVLLAFVIGQGLVYVWHSRPIHIKATKCDCRELEGAKPASQKERSASNGKRQKTSERPQKERPASNGSKEATKPVCLRNEFSDIVLVIVYNFPFYSSIPALTALYKNAFPTIMFCGPENAEDETVEVLPIHEGYFSYICISRAMEKHPGYSGYLLIGDDVMLNYWNLVCLNRSRIWVGPKDSIHFDNSAHDLRVTWYWWKTIWGGEACQKAYNEVINNHKDKQRYLLKLENVVYYCYHGRGDIFYIPGKFADAFKTLSDVFYKHRLFEEIAIPTMCAMLDAKENFEYIPGVYLPGGREELSKAVRFWEVYNTNLTFVHPFKLHYKNDEGLNAILLRNWIIEYSDGLSKCNKN